MSFMAQPQLDNRPGPKSIHCINPDCPCPYPQAWEDSSCSSCGTPLRLKNRYSTRQRLGVKGLATIYIVWDRKDKTECLLKVLRDESLQAQERFEQEAAILARLRHPSIIQASDRFTVALSHPRHRLLSCLVLEKIKGQTLKALIDHHPHGYPEAWALDWLRQAVEVLRELHEHQIVHCDINPSNLLCQDKQLTIGDLSAARPIGVKSKAQSRSQVTPYSPPEQTDGGIVGPTADFYALGRTFIHLFTGKCPQTLEESSSGNPRWRHSCPLVSQALADLLDEMTHTDVQCRPTTAAQIQVRLTKLALPRSSQQVPLKSTSRSTSKNTPKSITATAKHTPQRVSSPTAMAVGKLNPQRSPSRSKTSTAKKPNFLHATNTSSGLVVDWAKEVCRDTGRAMLSGTIGAIVGVAIAFGLNQWTPVGLQLVALLSQLTHLLSLAVPIAVPNLGRPEILILGLAGLGTAVGFTRSASFDQSQHAGVAQWMGFWGYIFGWLSFPVAPEAVGVQSWQVFSAIAVAVLTLGLSLPSHFLIHAIVAALGTAQVLAYLFTSNTGFAKCLELSTSTAVSSSADWSLLWHSITLFSFLALNLGFWLSVSFYLVVPSLRFLGWR